MLTQFAKLDTTRAEKPVKAKVTESPARTAEKHKTAYKPSDLFSKVVIIFYVPFSRMAKQRLSCHVSCYVWYSKPALRWSQPQIKPFYCLSTFTEERAIWNKLTINQDLQLPQIDQKLDNNNAVTSHVLPGSSLMGSWSNFAMAINVFISRFQ